MTTEHSNCIFAAAKWAATMTFSVAGYATADERLAAGIDVGALTADCVGQPPRGTWAPLAWP